MIYFIIICFCAFSHLLWPNILLLFAYTFDNIALQVFGCLKGIGNIKEGLLFLPSGSTSGFGSNCNKNCSFSNEKSEATNQTLCKGMFTHSRIAAETFHSSLQGNPHQIFLHREEPKTENIHYIHLAHIYVWDVTLSLEASCKRRPKGLETYQTIQ